MSGFDSPPDPRDRKITGDQDPRPWWYREDRRYDERWRNKLDTRLGLIEGRLANIEGEDRDQAGRRQGQTRTWSQIAQGIGITLGVLTIISLLIALLAQGSGAG